jgi:hypothetical protein
MEGHGDLNYDGRTDILGTGLGAVQFADLSCAVSGPPTWSIETADLAWSPSLNADGTYPTPGLIDLDGDGRMDLNYKHPTQGPTVVLHNSNVRSA